MCDVNNKMGYLHSVDDVDVVLDLITAQNLKTKMESFNIYSQTQVFRLLCFSIHFSRKQE